MTTHPQSTHPQSAHPPTRPAEPPWRSAWEDLDDRVRTWWDEDLHSATEQDVAADPTGTLLPLPHPYSTAGGGESAFPEMYGWDTGFINLGLLAHGRTDLVADHVRNQCHLIEQYGAVLNGNRSYYLTRSQPPLLADSVAHLAGAAPDLARSLAPRAYAALAAEHDGWWTAPHHRVGLREGLGGDGPGAGRLGAGLATARDLGDPSLRVELAAEAETGLDFTPLFGGDVRRCVPLILNCALVRTTQVLADLAPDEPARSRWRERTAARAAAIRAACWSPGERFFLERDVVADTHLPVRSLAAYLTLWAGVATAEQAADLVAALPAFTGSHGPAFTDRPHPSPHPEWQHLQWAHPTAWPPAQLWVVLGLRRYGHHDLARDVAASFVAAQVRAWGRTGQLWEKYHHADPDPGALPRERYASVPLHGWSSAAVAVLGRVALDLPRVPSLPPGPVGAVPEHASPENEAPESE